jgi:hypothetical protein
MAQVPAMSGLRDHFHPPLSERRHWHAFHNGWASTIAADLNRRLPEGYFAEPNVQFGIQIDVATFDETPAFTAPGGGWTPPQPLQTIPFPLVTDTVEVSVYSTEGGPVLTGAIELLSPSNKDRASHRDAFTSKCETLLQQGVGLVLADVVTSRSGSLHHELLRRWIAPAVAVEAAELYTAAYRPVERQGQPALDLWYEPLSLGQPLPTLPLWLRGGICVPVELDSTYEQTCRDQRIPG